MDVLLIVSMRHDLQVNGRGIFHGSIPAGKTTENHD
jgi:hypothetical protein